VKARDRRLMWGYGPALVILGGLLLVALLVPSVAPEEVVSSPGPSTYTPSGAVSNGSSGLPSPTANQPAGSGGGTSSVTGRSGGTSAVTNPGGPPPAPTGHVAACSGAQVHGDPYAPRCASFSGSNGGTTAKGVTANSIVVSYRITTDDVSSTDAAIQTLAGKYNKSEFSDTDADLERTLSDLVTYFNGHFQFYGRKLVLNQYHGQGSLATEITDGGQANANADALTVARSIKAFADVTGLTQPYAEALSSNGVINIGSPYMSAKWYQQHAPYAYSFFPNCTDLAAEGAAVVIKQMLPQKVTWAGAGVADGQPRRYAVLAPDNPVYQSCADVVTKAMQRAGHPPVANLSYTLDLSQLSQEASSIEQRIVNDKITTVLCGCDPITLIYLTGDLDNAGYEPEFANIGAAFTDEDLLAQLMDQSAWAHAMGETNNGTIPSYGASLGYFAAKSVDPTHAPARAVDTIYEDLYILALGIQGAGPDLTPLTFEHGLWSYAGGNGEYGPWSFVDQGTGSWTPQHEFRYEWWNPNGTSSFNGEKGTWEVGSNWYTTETVPSGPPAVFPRGPQ
jgi:hypothetical protein